MRKEALQDGGEKDGAFLGEPISETNNANSHKYDRHD